MLHRPTEARHHDSAGIHALPGAEVLSRLLAAQGAAVAAVRLALPGLEQAAEVAALALRGGGKLAYAGAGSSGLMALADSLELAGTFGIPPARTPVLFAGGASALLHMTGGPEDDADQARAEVVAAGITEGDAVICVAASGGTPYTLAVAQAAAGRGARVIGLANVPGSRLLDLSHVPVLLETGPEVVSGSTRLGAGTAQKVALNLISVLVGIRLGHVHDGYMVNVVADNAKLLDRAARIVAAVSGRDAQAAQAALSAAGGAVKPAILIAAGLTPEAAQAALNDSDGVLGPALATLNN